MAVLSLRAALKFSLLIALAMPMLPGLAVVYYLSGLLLENIYAYSYTRVLPTSWVEFTTATGNLPRFEQLPVGVQLVMLVTVVAKLVLFGLLIWCVSALVRWAWQRSRPSADELLSRNLVRPITLIRSFRDDAKALYGFSLVSWLFFRKFRIEEILGSVVRQTGALIAIGQPGDRSPPLGAYRDYFEGEDWRDAIIDWMTRSELVVVIAGQTEGLAWELRQLKARDLLPRTIFVFPDDAGEGTRARLQSISETVLGQSLQVPATGAKGGSLLAISFSSDSAMAVFGNARYAEDLSAAIVVSRAGLSK